jgi:hypothetical protein
VGSRAGFEDGTREDWEGIKGDPIRGMDDEGMVQSKT